MKSGTEIVFGINKDQLPLIIKLYDIKKLWCRVE